MSLLKIFQQTSSRVHFNSCFFLNRPFLRSCRSFRISNASDKRYFDEMLPLKNVTQAGSAILSKTLNLAAQNAK